MSINLSCNRPEKNAFSSLKDLEGWHSEEKISCMMDLIIATKSKNYICVEIGGYGESLAYPILLSLLNQARDQRGLVYIIDPYTNEQATFDANLQYIKANFIKNLEKHQLNNLYITVSKTSKEAVYEIPPEIDTLHINGNRSEESLASDVQLYLTNVKKGGHIWISNFNQRNTSALKKAISLLEKQCELIYQNNEEESFVLFKKRDPTPTQSEVDSSKKPIAIIKTWADLPYQGKMEAQLNQTQDGKIFARIETDHYYGLPASLDDLSFCHERLFGNETAMRNYLNNVRTLQNTKERLERYVSRFENKDPFSGFIFRRKDDDTPVALAVLGHGGAYVDENGNEHYTMNGEEPDGAAGVAQYALIVDPQFHQQSIGKEITSAMFLAWAPKLVELGYMANIGEKHILPAPLCVIEWTTRNDNPVYSKLENFANVGASQKFCGNLRSHFYIPMSTIQDLKNGKEIIFYNARHVLDNP